MFDPTSDPPSPTTTRGAIFVFDAQNQPPTDEPDTIPPVSVVTSTSSTAGFLADGVSAAFDLSETYDYFLQKHGRDSLDGEGGTMQAIVRLGQGLQNAFYDPSEQLMAFGDSTFAGALDVAGHELAHGVTEHTAGLIYQNQSGALNEAFSAGRGVTARRRCCSIPWSCWSGWPRSGRRRGDRCLPTLPSSGRDPPGGLRSS